ncbi:MAG: hypothetical protein KF773_09830 [Deltaproteobacteria bacterium]|nr:hypothetical protein [Deltaproteobacteria bacterium]
MRHHLAWFVAALSATGCPNVKVDPGEGPDDLPTIDGPTVEFDPGNKIIPFPNNLVRTGPGGTVALPAQCNESAASKATRENVINKLDGFGTYQAAMQVTFTEAVDPASLAGKIVVIKRKTGDTVVEPGSAQAIPEAALIVAPGETTRFKPDCSAPETVSSVTIVSALPLEPNSTYVVAVLDGVKTAGGKSFIPSFTWELVRQPELPVVLDDNGNVITNRTPLNPNNEEQLERLRGVNLLWNVHAQALGFLAATGTPRNKTLIAWEFTTQTTTAPLDRAVAGSPASMTADAALPATAPLGTLVRGQLPFSLCPGGESDTQCFLKTAIGSNLTADPTQFFAAGNAACSQLGCAAVGDIRVTAPEFNQFQVKTPNSFAGAGAQMIPGPWSDPRTPALVGKEPVSVLISLPAAPPTDPNGYPVLIFQHGLTRSKSDAAIIIGALSARGFAVFAIDAQAHGSRAVRVSNNAAIGCADAPQLPAPLGRADLGPDPSKAPQCYAPFLSPDLGATRDNIRQSILDLQQLVAFVKGCGTANCLANGANIKVDATKMFYMGQSLGGIMGGMATAIAPDLKGGVLNVPAMGWADILENTASLGIRCSLVNGLIDAGILVGEKSDLLNTTGLCTTDDWKTQPGYRQFAVIGRWVLDPADPANFAAKLATKRVLIQEVVGDLVVPNIATDREGALLRLTAEMADPAPPLQPSAAITTNPTSSKFVKYSNLPANAQIGFPGNSFAHGSLLAPANGNADGSLGTARMQTDAITYLTLNAQ